MLQKGNFLFSFPVPKMAPLRSILSFYAQLGALNNSTSSEATQFIFVSRFLLLFSNKYFIQILFRCGFMFNQCLCQVEPIGSSWVLVNLILLKNRNFCAHENNFSKSQKRAFALFLFAVDQQTNCPGLPVLVGFLEFQKYSKVPDCYRLFYF